MRFLVFFLLSFNLYSSPLSDMFSCHFPIEKDKAEFIIGASGNIKIVHGKNKCHLKKEGIRHIDGKIKKTILYFVRKSCDQKLFLKRGSLSFLHGQDPGHTIYFNSKIGVIPCKSTLVSSKKLIKFLNN